MAITQEAAVASIIPSPLAKSKLTNGASSGIFVDPSIGDECFPGERTLTVGNVLNKLANKCAAFQSRLAQGERVQGIDIAPLCATSGYTSNLFRCAIKMVDAADGITKTGPEAFRLILKVFSPDRIKEMFVQVMGKDKAEEVREQIAKMELEANRKRAESDAQQNGGQQNGVQNGGMEGQQPVIARMHRNECVFYDFIGTNFTENPLPLPEVYFTQIGGGPQGEHGLIAMEDLHDAFLVDIGHGLNRQQALNIIEHMAHLHAHVMQPKLAHWKAQFMTPEEIFGMDEQPEEAKAFFMEMMMAHAPVEFMVSLKRMQKLVANADVFGKWAKKKMEEEYGMCDILTHGDLWVNNLLWHNTRPNELAAFIDWQLAQRSPPMTDISYILLMCAEPELRHEMEADGTMLAHYLNSLNGKLEEIGMPSAPFGLEELEHAYKLTQVGQSTRMIMALQLFNQTWDDVSEKERKLAALLRRCTIALEDSVKALEQEAPEWLVPADEEEEKETKKGGED